MPEFFETRMGRTFYEHTMPMIADELKRLNDLLERILIAVESSPSDGSISQDSEDNNE